MQDLGRLPIRRNIAEGTVWRQMRRCVVGFDDETFAQIRTVAKKNKCSFGAVVRLLVEFGLEDLKA